MVGRLLFLIRKYLRYLGGEVDEYGIFMFLLEWSYCGIYFNIVFNSFSFD